VGFVFEGSLAFLPNNVAYGSNQGSSINCALFGVDTTSGAATVVGTISGGPHDINGLAWRNDGRLVGLDRESNSLLQISPVTANVEAVIAILDPILGGIGGMAVVDDVAYFTTAGPTAALPGSNELYSVNLFTGEHELVGSLAPTITGVGISGLALPAPGTLTLLAVGSLAAIRRRR
jgi:hypothetical protein